MTSQKQKCAHLAHEAKCAQTVGKQTFRSHVVLHSSVSRRKPYPEYFFILACSQITVKKQIAVLGIFYEFTTNAPDEVCLFVEVLNRLAGGVDYRVKYTSSPRNKCSDGCRFPGSHT